MNPDISVERKPESNRRRIPLPFQDRILFLGIDRPDTARGSIISLGYISCHDRCIDDQGTVFETPHSLFLYADLDISAADIILFTALSGIQIHGLAALRDAVVDRLNQRIRCSRLVDAPSIISACLQRDGGAVMLRKLM